MRRARLAVQTGAISLAGSPTGPPRCSDDPLKTIGDLCAGLEYPSETDAPLIVLSAHELSVPCAADDLRAYLGVASSEPVEPATLDWFFKPVTSIEDWYDEEQRLTTNRFVALYDALRVHGDRVQVLRVGRRMMDVIVLLDLGLDDIIVIRTKIVET